MGSLKTNYLFVYLLIYIVELWVSRPVNGSFKSTQRPSGVAAPKKEATNPGTENLRQGRDMGIYASTKNLSQ